MKRAVNIYARAIEPITRQEFWQMLQKAKPPPGWGQKIAVANSGGPDSTCLLFLLHQHFSSSDARSSASTRVTERDRPRVSVVSLTVDHALQESSADMAAKTAKFAESLGVQHYTSKIEWDNGIFPPKPTPGTPFESLARNARYRLLFDQMTRLGVNTLGAGHHLDDQCETALMRLGMGSTILGMGGMQYYRRWGMGSSSKELDWAGHQGMNRWIVRPFLGVGKDRILATCEANRLEYVVDKTNFQPEVTLRNAIRHVIKHGKESSESFPPDLSKQIELIDTALGGHLDMGREKLQSFALGMSKKVSQVEEDVDAFIEKARLPSPEGTFLISEKALSSLGREDPLRQTALVLRVLRYVSPKPWGSLQAQVRRRVHRLDELVSRLQMPITRTTSPFTMGSEVLWKPVIYRARKIKNLAESAPRPEDVNAWFACRQPPDPQTAHATADVDLSESLLGAFAARTSKNGTRHFEFMYDCRFLVRMDLDALPEELVPSLSASKSRLILSCKKPWFYPRVSLQTGDRTQLLHDEITPLHELSSRKRTTWKPEGQKSTRAVDWISVTFIRTLQ